MLPQLQQQVLVTHQRMEQVTPEQRQLFAHHNAFLRRHGFRPAQRNRVFVHQGEIHLLTVELCFAQRLQHRNGGAARQADPVVLAFIMNVLIHQRGQHPGAGAHANRIVSVDKPLAAVAVHFCAVGQAVLQRVLHHKQRQRGGDQPGAPRGERRTVAEGLFGIAVLRNKHGLPPFVVFHPRRPERRLGFQGAVKGGDLPGSIVFHRPLVADVGK